MAKSLFLVVLISAMMFILFSSADARHDVNKNKRNDYHGVYKTNGSPAQTLVNINNMAMWVRDDGLMERRPQDNNAGVTFPRGTSTIVYAGGLIWGGMVVDGGAQNPRVGGQSYNYGTDPGRIISKGVAESPGDPSVRAFRIRRDWKTVDLARDAAEFFDVALSSVSPDQIAQVRAQYKKDWIEWPAQKGAPYYDRNGNGTYDPDPAGLYDPTKDEPGLGGADQVVWFVANDLKQSSTTGLYGSNPIGMEMQVTLWAYARTDELGNVIFQRYRIIYKGTAATPANAHIDSMYLAKWVDPDLGDFGDDYAGSVIDKSLGYVYNGGPVDAEYKKFDLVPPVVGYDFFQGPRVKTGDAGDVARWDFTQVSGAKNLPMTTFAYFAAHGTDYDPILGNYDGTLQFYNLLSGFRPRPIAPADCHHDPTQGNACNKYMLAGDPINRSGWVDGGIDPPGDRRIVLGSGPFTMALGDTQEVVIGLVGALGKDYLDGIDVLKGIDDVAQDAFNLNFELPSPVSTPNLKITELDKKFILDWESDTTTLRQIETYSSKGYNFETYKIYQFPFASSTLEQAKKFPAYDKASPRYLQVTRDNVRDHALVNGQRYYFGISAVVYNPDPALVKKRIESPILIRLAIPHSPNPGAVYPFALDTPLVDMTQNIVGANDAHVTFTYLDQTQSDGHAYRTVFHYEPVSEAITCDLIDDSTSETLLQNLSVTGTPNPQRIISRRFTFQATSPQSGIKGVFQTASAGNSSLHAPAFESADAAGSFMIVGRAAGASTVGSIAAKNTDDHDMELRFKGDSSWALIVRGDVEASIFIRVPYTMWRIGKSSEPDKQLYTVIRDQGQDVVWKATTLLDRLFLGKAANVFYPVTVIADSAQFAADIPAITYDSLIGTKPSDDFDVLVAKQTLYSASQGSTEAGASVYKFYVVDLDDDGIPAPNGTVIRFEKFKKVRDGDTRVFKATKVQKYNLSSAKKEVERVNVFPNPYYGLNRSELSRFRRFVTFNHLPSYAKIRVFNLAGILVRTITKQDDPSSPTQFANWDLNNETGLPAASGLYIAYLELKSYNDQGSLVDLGTKTLKIMIVQEQQFLESF